MAEKKARKKPQIKVVSKGPYMVTGLKHLKNWKGEDLPVKVTTSLCRCGASKNKPYCDGTHLDIGFKDE